MSESTKIDRQTTTPFLLRLFYRSGSFHRQEEFTPSGPLPQHVQIYTWQSCSLKELTHLIATALPSILPSPSVGTRLCFRLIYPDTQGSRHGPGRYLMKELGTVVIGPDASDSDDRASAKAIIDRLEGDAEKTLSDVRFIIGDYVSCAVLAPLANGDVAPLPRPGPSRPPVAPRENGFGGGYGGYSSRRGGGGGGGRYDADRDYGDRPSGGVPSGEWRRGDVPPGGSFRGRGRGRGRGW